MLSLFLLSSSYVFHNYNLRRNNHNLVSRVTFPQLLVKPDDLITASRLIKKSEDINYWSYKDLFDNFKQIDSAAIVSNTNTAVFHLKDKINQIQSESTISPEDLYLYKYLPDTATNLVEQLMNNHINFQVYDFQNSNSPGFPFFEYFIGFITFSIIFNTIRALLGNGMSMNPNMNNFKNNRLNNPINNLFDESDTNNNNNKVTFKDVAGIEEAKEELYEIVDFLKDPEKYAIAGAKVPRGVLLEGPPGTGKTLLARAVAGEADVNFLSASGSEFIEMFVGVGAQRVRALFNEAKKLSPCVIFIDEIDAVGGKRGYGFNSGGNDEREQTLNQILTNMDGFEKTEGIIVIAATNRIDTLDSALLRAGRFDRKVKVALPDIKGREDIAKVHFRDKFENISYSSLAALTSGFSGADIANLANEAAILSVRSNQTVIDDSIVIKAYEKVTIGLPKKYDSRPDKIKSMVAAHEVGHALAVQHFSKFFELKSITINANTAGAGGYTLFTPNELYSEYPTKGFYLAQMIVAMGGRAAETVYFSDKYRYNDNNKSSDIIIDPNELIFRTSFPNYDDLDITTGASGDLQQANKIARQYIQLFENYLVLDEYNNNYGENTKSQIETRINELVNESLEKAINIILANKNRFNELIEELLYYKTINL